MRCARKSVKKLKRTLGGRSLKNWRSSEGEIEFLFTPITMICSWFFIVHPQLSSGGDLEKKAMFIGGHWGYYQLLTRKMNNMFGWMMLWYVWMEALPYYSCWWTASFSTKNSGVDRGSSPAASAKQNRRLLRLFPCEFVIKSFQALWAHRVYNWLFQ